MSQVVLQRADNYSVATVRPIIENIFSSFTDDININAGDTVLIKPNFIAPKPLESGAVTHMSVLLEITKVLLDLGSKPFIAESPAWGNIHRCLQVFGHKEEFDKLGVKFKQLDSPVRTVIDGHKIGISRLALEADKIVNVPKFKAHQQLGATFAIKNLYGCVPGKEKAVHHLTKGKDYDKFCRMIVGIYTKLNPVINIIDGITAMEGMGPLSGKPKHLGVIVAGTDPLACERVCAEIACFDLNKLGLFQTAKKMNLGCSRLDQIEIIGSDIDSVKCTDFVHSEQIELFFSFTRVCKSICKQIIHTIQHPHQRGSTPNK